MGVEANVARDGEGMSGGESSKEAKSRSGCIVALLVVIALILIVFVALPVLIGVVASVIAFLALFLQ